MKSGVTHLLLHPTGMYPSDIPAQACTETTYPFPARIILSSANANAGYYKQYTIASSLFNRKTTNACQMPRPHALSVPADRCGVSLLYIKQLHTPPGVSCCQPLFLHILMHLLTKLEKTSLSLRMGFLTKFMLRLRLHSLSVQCLSLTLFVLRVLTDYSDAALTLDDFAFFANRFYWWSNLHSNSPFLTATRISDDQICPLDVHTPLRDLLETVHPAGRIRVYT